MATQPRKKLSKRSVNRVAGELKAAFDKQFSKKIYYKIRLISRRFRDIGSYGEQMREKLNGIISDKKFTNPLLRNIECKAMDIGYVKDGIIDNIEQVKEMLKLQIDIENLKKDLVYLLDNYDYVNYKDGILTVQTDDICVEGVAFGPFDIILNVNSNSEINYKFTCKALKPNRRDGHPHPNITSGDSGNLCVGKGYYALEKSFSQGRIGDFMDIVQRILNTYSQDPFYGLSNWR
jgi:hypothetical protein